MCWWKLLNSWVIFCFSHLYSRPLHFAISRKKGLFVLARALFQHGINVRKHYQFLEISLMAKTQQIFFHFRCDLEIVFFWLFSAVISATNGSFMDSIVVAVEVIEN